MSDTPNTNKVFINSVPYVQNESGEYAVPVSNPDGSSIGGTETSAANTARTTATQVLPVQQVAADGTADKLTTLQNLVGGGVAANAADSGNPVKVGGKYTAAGVTLDDGDRGDLALDVNSNAKVTQATALGRLIDSVTSNPVGVGLLDMSASCFICGASVVFIGMYVNSPSAGTFKL